jgi:hypothetical protein
MELRIFKTNLVHTLYQNVENNLNLYENGDFTSLLEPHIDQIRTVPGVHFDETMFGNMFTSSGGTSDAKNAYLILNGLDNFNPYLATDERVWVALCHLEGRSFVSKRWLKKDAKKSDKIQSIKSHFFAKGHRGFQRHNALASIWWWAYIATRHGPKDYAKAIDLFCTYTDVRSQIIDRTSISRGENTYVAILNCIEKKIMKDPHTTVFSRKKGKGNQPGLYKEWFAKINRWGGRKFMEAFSPDELTNVFYGLLEDTEKNASVP